jgi:phosphotransferase system  glucose/maltose/N-acetylglucosamine-specific IIC component
MEKKENVSGRIRAKAGVQNGIVSEDEFQRVANKVSFVTIIGNILLSVMKLIAGFIAHSNAMISDAILSYLVYSIIITGVIHHLVYGIFEYIIGCLYDKYKYYQTGD